MCAKTNFLVFPQFQTVIFPVAPLCRSPITSGQSLTGVLQLHACRTPSRTTHAEFFYPSYRFVAEFWDIGLPRESLTSIPKQSDTRSVCSTYSSRCSGRRCLAPASGISLQTDSVDPIPPLSISFRSFPAGKPADNKLYTRNIPSPSLASLPIYPTQYSSGLPVVPSPRSSIPARGSPWNSSFPGCGLPATGPKSCLRRRTAIPESRFWLNLRSLVPVRPSLRNTIYEYSRRRFCQPERGLEEQLVTSRSILDGDKIADPFVSSVSEDINSLHITVILGVVGFSLVSRHMHLYIFA